MQFFNKLKYLREKVTVKAKKKILQVVIRNTSTLDVTLPLFAHNHTQGGDLDVSVLYMSLNKSQLVRSTSGYGQKLDAYNCKQYDYLNFLKYKIPFFQSLLRMLFACSLYDRVSLKQVFMSLFKGGRLTCLFPGVRRRISIWVTKHLVDTHSIFETLKPDVVLLDYRDKVHDASIEVFAKYWKDNGVKVVFLPHAPHDIREASEYVPYQYDEDDLPSYCYYWEPFIHHKTWKMNEAKKDNFIYFGYPGLDSSWLDELRKEVGGNKGKAKASPIKVMLVIRKFTPEAIALNPDELFLQSYQEVFKQIKLTVDALNDCDVDYELIVKPHPSASEFETREIMEKVGSENYSISYEPYFKVMQEVDFVVSSFSTTMVLPPLYGMPLVIYNDRTMAYVEKWDVLKSLYGGYEFYSKNDGGYQKNIKEIMHALVSGNADLDERVELDKKHVREFFPDNSAQHILGVLESILGRK